MRVAAMIIACLLPLAASAEEPTSARRVAVVVGLNRPSSAFIGVPKAHESAASLVEVLGSTAGYSDVRALIGPVASASTVMDTVHSAMRDIGEDGFLLFVYVGHGVGGDFGEPALMTHGATVRDPLRTGVDVAELAAALQPSQPGQQVLVVIDAVHVGDVEGVALIGPRASEWPQASAGLTVVTPHSAAVDTPGPGIVAALTEALSEAADTDSDGHVRMSELFRMMGASLSDQNGPQMDTSGAVSSESVVARVHTKSVGKKKKRIWDGHSMTLLVVGGALGSTSTSMYAAKRGQCEGEPGDLRCGDGRAYRRYQQTQHALGVVGAGLVLAGVGVHLVPSTSSMTVQVQGSF